MPVDQVLIFMRQRLQLERRADVQVGIEGYHLPLIAERVLLIVGVFVLIIEESADGDGVQAKRIRRGGGGPDVGDQQSDSWIAVDAGSGGCPEVPVLQRHNI